MKIATFSVKDSAKTLFLKYVCRISGTTKIIIKTIKATLCVVRAEASASGGPPLACRAVRSLRPAALR
ncbi:MAG: hypothetical protein K2I97_04000, partial [Alistipes sp.]|nr:hypothetical protein [Alistipes sp.]